MSQEGAIAPKEPINIVYKPAGEGTEQVELPFKILSLGDYIGQTDNRPIIDREPINIDKDNFAAVMSEHKLQVELVVPNKLRGEDDEASDIKVDLRFGRLHDFTPDGIANQVPELKELLDLRNALAALKYPLNGIPEFSSYLKEILSDEQARERLLHELSGDEQESPEAD